MVLRALSSSSHVECVVVERSEVQSKDFLGDGERCGCAEGADDVCMMLTELKRACRRTEVAGIGDVASCIERTRWTSRYEVS